MLECSSPTLKPECSLSVVNTEGHFTETTPMRELIKEMPGIVFPVDHLCDFDLLATWALLSNIGALGLSAGVTCYC